MRTCLRAPACRDLGGADRYPHRQARTPGAAAGAGLLGQSPARRIRLSRSGLQPQRGGTYRPRATPWVPATPSDCTLAVRQSALRPFPGRSSCRVDHVTPLQGSICVLSLFPGRCPGLVCHGLSGLIHDRPATVLVSVRRTLACAAGASPSEPRTGWRSHSCQRLCACM